MGRDGKPSSAPTGEEPGDMSVQGGAVGLHRSDSKPGWQLGVLLLALAALALPAGRADAQAKILHESLITENNANPIRISTDYASVWTEGDQRIFLVWGNVVVAQGTTQVRLPQGVIWIDEGNQKKTGTYQVTIYGEGNIALEHGTTIQGDWGFVHLATRGDVPIKAFKGKIEKQNLSQHPTYLRAAGQKPATPPATGASVQRADLQGVGEGSNRTAGAILPPDRLPVELKPTPASEQGFGTIVPTGGVQPAPIPPQPLSPPTVLPPVSPLVEQKSFQIPRDNNNAPKEQKSFQPPRDNNPPQVVPIPNIPGPTQPPLLPPDNNGPAPLPVVEPPPPANPPRRVTIRPRSATSGARCF